MMEYKFLGKSGLKISRLCLGTMNFVQLDEKEAFRIMDAALDAGITVFDTADCFGEPENKGRTEELIGKWFLQCKGRRERVVLITKVYEPVYDMSEGPNDDWGLSAYKMRRHIEKSLCRLCTDHIELYQMHHIAKHVTWSEIWEVYDSFIKEGKIVYASSSNFAAWNIVQAQNEAQKRNMLGLICEEHRYNLVCRLPELEVLPAIENLGIGMLAWGPLGGGILSGNFNNPVSSSRSAREAKRDIYNTPVALKQLADYVNLSKELGFTEAQVSLAWILANPVVTAAIIGPHCAEQVYDSVKALDVKLDEKRLAEIDCIFPGPGGKAPEAYAW